MSVSALWRVILRSATSASVRTLTLVTVVTLGLAAHAAPLQTGTLRLEVGVAGAPVQIDGKPVGVTPLPGPWALSPGAHTLSVTPTDGPGQTVKFQIIAGKQTALKLLTQRPAPPKPKVEAPAAPARKVVQTGAGFPVARAGYVTAGVGVAALGAAVFFGLQADDAAAQARDLDRRDPANRRADLQALVDDADQAAFTANLLYGVGGVALLTGAAMALWGADGLLSGGVTVVPAAGGAGLAGRF